MNEEAEQAAIEQAARREAWSEVAAVLDRAKDAVEHAQGVLSDWPLHSEPLADQLQPLYDDLRRAATELRDRVGT